MVNRRMVNGTAPGRNLRPIWLIWREGRASAREDGSDKLLKKNSNYQG